MKVLLTGGTGFLGKNLQRYFQNDKHYDVVALSSKMYDLRCGEACRRAIEYYAPNVIIHAAGSVGGILANQQNPGKFMYDNLAMGMNMLEQARVYQALHTPLKFIMLGTVCAYPKYTPVPFQESELWNGYPEETNAPYGIAKKTLMKLGETYHQQYNMDVVNLVPVNMYGPHDHFNLTSAHVIPALILKFHEAIKNNHDVTVWGSGKASREFLYAPDCAEAIKLAIESDVGPEPINIGTGKEIRILDLAEEIALQMNFNGSIIFDSRKPDGQPRRCLDTTLAEKLLGFKAKTDFQTGLKQTIQWFLGEQR